MSARIVTLPLPRGPVAWAPKAWGDEYDISAVDQSRRVPFTLCGSYAVVDICGPLFFASHWCCDSYDAIKARARAAFASAAPNTLLRVASPGGDFAGCLDLSRELRAMAREANKKLCAWTGSQCASAAFALACAADDLVVTESGNVGSIGVWMPLVDETERAKAMGYRVEIVASGQAKTDRQPMVPMTEAAVSRAQAEVDDMARLFFELVSEQRGIPVSRIAALDGAQFMGARALAVGLADRIATFDQLVTGAASSGARGERAMGKYSEEARVALRRAAESGDEDEKKMAEKALKALEPEQTETDDEKAKKAKAEQEKKDADEKAKAAAEEQEKKDADEKAKALAAAAAGAGPIGALILEQAREIHGLKSRIDARDSEDKAKAAAAAEQAEREAIYRKRPDFDARVRALFDALPIAKLREAAEGPKAWSRVNAQPGSSAAAQTVVGSGGERLAGGDYQPSLSATDQALLDKCKPEAAAPQAARVIGTQMVVEYFDKTTATKRRDELAKQLGMKV